MSFLKNLLLLPYGIL